MLQISIAPVMTEIETPASEQYGRIQVVIKSVFSSPVYKSEYFKAISEHRLFTAFICSLLYTHIFKKGVT